MEGKRKYKIRLDAEQRARLEEITRNGHAPAKKLRHARVLLMSDEDHHEGRWPDAQIARILGMHVNTVARTRRHFVQGGEEPALERKPRDRPPVEPKLDGEGEAQLVAICCSQPPEGRRRWTLSLLAEELVSRGVVASVCVETVRKSLKKTSSSRGAPGAFASRNGTRRGS